MSANWPEKFKAWKIFQTAALRETADAGNLHALNEYAWLLATSADPDLRNGNLAVAYAEKGAAISARKDAPMLDTLAAAYAEAARFNDAIQVEKEAIMVSTNFIEKNDFSSRVRLYESNMPYHETKK